ncbi:MAG: hypothetical protein ACP5MC_00900 [Candidatus Micrarchaeia archaeon]
MLLLLSIISLWMPVAVVGAVAILAIVALIYELSPLFGRNDLRIWARTEIYEVLFSLLLIGIFVAIFAIFTKINFKSAYGPLVPTSCSQSSPDLYSLSMCEMSSFESNVSAVNQIGFAIAFVIASALSWQGQFSLPLGVAKISGSTILTLAPQSMLSSYLLYISMLFSFYILSRILLLLLATAPILVSIFMAIGLISRIFSITRSFGGAMIAFGVGIGIILPLLLATTYGFIDVALQNSYAANDLRGLSVIWNGPEAILGLLTFTNINFLIPIAIVFVGLLFIPVIDLVLVDVFIRDFSQAVGERMDFLSLMTNISSII